MIETCKYYNSYWLLRSIKKRILQVVQFSPNRPKSFMWSSPRRWYHQPNPRRRYHQRPICAIGRPPDYHLKLPPGADPDVSGEGYFPRKINWDKIKTWKLYLQRFPKEGDLLPQGRYFLPQTKMDWRIREHRSPKIGDRKSLCHSAVLVVYMF